MKRQLGPTARGILLLVGILLNGAIAFVACYKGDPGYGGGDYPPEPPITERACDAGSDR